MSDDTVSLAAWLDWFMGLVARSLFAALLVGDGVWELVVQRGSCGSRAHFRKAVQDAALIASPFFERPLTRAEQREIEREVLAALANPHEWTRDRTAAHLRLLVDVQSVPTQQIGADIFAMVDGLPRRVARARRRVGARECDQPRSTTTEDTGGEDGPCVCVDVPLVHQSQTVGFIRLLNIDPEAMTPAMRDYLDGTLVRLARQVATGLPAGRPVDHGGFQPRNAEER